jgi:hypothetical protein
MWAGAAGDTEADVEEAEAEGKAPRAEAARTEGGETEEPAQDVQYGMCRDHLCLLEETGHGAIDCGDE